MSSSEVNDMSTVAHTSSGRRLWSANVLIPVATITSNVLSYGLFLAAARVLDRAVYGETLALLNLVLIATIPMFAIQTVVARLTATRSVPERTAGISVLVGVGGALVMFAVAPLVVSFLYLPSYWGMIGAAMCVPPLAVLGLAQGAAQGRHHWQWLCGALTLMGIGRVLGGVLGLFLTHSSGGTLIGTAIGLWIAAVIVWRPAVRLTYLSVPQRGISIASLLREIAHAAHAHGAFLFLSSLDLVLARHILSPADAGLYAAGAVIFKAALWLPQPVSIMLFADLSLVPRHRAAVRRGLLIVGLLVAATIAGCLVLGRIVAIVVGGASYGDLASEAWLFAVAGGALALIQFAIFSGLAMLRRRRLTYIWMCVVAEVVAMLMLGEGATPRQFISIVAILCALTSVFAMIAALKYDPIKTPPKTVPAAQVDGAKHLSS
ncbi:MAG: hypothetical protein ABI137_07125 [Antricoccus sp.]